MFQDKCTIYCAIVEIYFFFTVFVQHVHGYSEKKQDSYFPSDTGSTSQTRETQCEIIGYDL